jgi:hypothetical protein
MKPNAGLSTRVDKVSLCANLSDVVSPPLSALSKVIDHEKKSHGWPGRQQLMLRKPVFIRLHISAVKSSCNEVLRKQNNFPFLSV